MLKPKEMIRKTAAIPKDESLPCEFGLLCWNVHKQNDRIRFNHQLEMLFDLYPVDLVALQEVRINVGRASLFDRFHLSFAPNIKFFNSVFGVLSGSYVPETAAYSLLSSHRESIIRTHKSAVFSSYPLFNGETLLLINLHAINFRRSEIYNKEMEIIAQEARGHTGPMIVAGDFNSWNQSRMEILTRFTRLLDLHSIEMKRGHLIKSFMRHKLDHVFYRGLQLIESHVIDTPYSDHNPLYVRFLTP